MCIFFSHSCCDHQIWQNMPTKIVYYLLCCVQFILRAKLCARCHNKSTTLLEGKNTTTSRQKWRSFDIRISVWTPFEWQWWDKSCPHCFKMMCSFFGKLANIQTATTAKENKEKQIHQKHEWAIYGRRVLCVYAHVCVFVYFLEQKLSARILWWLHHKSAYMILSSHWPNTNQFSNVSSLYVSFLQTQTQTQRYARLDAFYCLLKHHI